VKTAVDMQEKSRLYRKRLRHAGIKVAPEGRPLSGTIASGWKHRMDGGWERRASTRLEKFNRAECSSGEQRKTETARQSPI